MADRCAKKYPSAIKKRVEGDWNCPSCDNLNFAFRVQCNICENRKEIKNAFDSVLYIDLPALWKEKEEETEETEETNVNKVNYWQLPSVSPFFQDKFMMTPLVTNPVASKLLSFHGNSAEQGTEQAKEKENRPGAVIVTDKYRILTQKKDLAHYLSGVKKPNTRKEGDWVCLQCKNLNFAFRTTCNVCRGSKIEYIAM